MKKWILIICLVSMQVVLPSLHAGFLDKLVNKTTEKVKQAVEKKVDKEVDEGIDTVLDPDEQSAQKDPEKAGNKTSTDPAGNKGKTPTAITSDNKPTTVKAMALAVIKVAPEFFDIRPEQDIKELLIQIFPKESEIKTNDFYWHKNKADLISKALALSVDAPVTFEVAPWIDNSPDYGYSFQKKHYFQPMFGKYDFENRAFPVYPTNLEIPWLAGATRSNVGSYEFSGIRELEENYMVPVDINQAETITNAQGGTSKLYSHFTFTIEGVTGLLDITEHPEYAMHQKYLEMGGEQGDAAFQQLKPRFDIRIENSKVDLYVANKPIYSANDLVSQSDLEFFATLEMQSSE